MKFTLNWLKEHLDTTADLEAISRSLTAIGLEVEGITDVAESLSAFTVAEILEATQHPDADKLRVCRVKSDVGELQIVCGAPNARAGIKVALAKEGAIIPNGGFAIKKSKIRGVESCGMLCSAKELDLGSDHQGIMELPADAAIGASIVDVLGLNDPVIEIAITPNRGDCLGVYGIARDLAAAGVGTLKPLNVPAAAGSTKADTGVRIETEHCKQFAACVIKGVKNGPSPEWLQQRLRAVGLRPISTLVDITNYFTVGYGRPLHVYDQSKLNGDIVVTTAKGGETLEALNDKTYTLKGGECVIADAKGALGIGGVVGGVPSGVTEGTTDVVLECAWFESAHIAQTGRTLGIDSDARYRFERTVDPEFVVPGALLAVEMILRLCGGTASELLLAGECARAPRNLPFDPDFTNQLGGVDIARDEQLRILSTLGFTANGDTLNVPSWRQDVEGKADIAEEVLRIYGYDNLPSTPMPKLASVSPAALTQAQARIRSARRILAARGLAETHTWAFMAEERAALFGDVNPDLKLLNPISSDLGVMRPTLIANLLDGLTRNAARGMQSMGLFEVGPQFSGITPAGQHSVGCAVRMGKAVSKQWTQGERQVDCFDAKADAVAILEVCGVDTSKLQVITHTPHWYHPGRSGALCLGPKNILAYFGELHPETLQAFDCEQTVVACEVMFDAIPQSKKKATAALQRSDYQAVERDFAFVLNGATPAEELLRAVQGADKQLIQQVKLFDVYQGKGLDEDQKSLAISVRLQAMDRTLSDEEIDSSAKKIIAAAEKSGAKLRA